MRINSKFELLFWVKYVLGFWNKKEYYHEFYPQTPFGGYKNSGNGRERGLDVNPEMQKVFQTFRSCGLVEISDSNTWKLTDKGKFRMEEMAYYIAKHDLDKRLTSVKPDEINKNPNHCFPYRTPEQNKKFESALKSI